MRDVATEPPAPADIASADELFITAEHLDQYRHPTRLPEAYLDELLRRDPEDSRAHTLYGKRLISRGLLAEAEAHLVRAVKRQTRRQSNPYTGEALYNLGLARDLQGKLDSAYPCYFKATWNGEFRAAGYYRLSTIDARRGDWAKAREHADRSFATPPNLGEAYHLLQAKADVNYLRGKALQGLGRADAARAAFAACAAEAGDFQSMAVTTYSELSYYRGLALAELGRTDEAKALFEGMRAFAEKGLATPFKIDYFATSLPLLLIFEDDLEAVKNAQMENLRALAGKGLSVIEGK